MPLTAHASAYASLAFADGGSRNSSLHPPLEALGISTLAQGSREARSVRLAEHRGAEGVPAPTHRFNCSGKVGKFTLTLSKCAATGGTHSFFMHPKGALHVPKARFIRRRRASFSIILPHGVLYLPIHYKGKGVGGVVENRREGLHILLGVSAQNPIG